MVTKFLIFVALAVASASADTKAIEPKVVNGTDAGKTLILLLPIAPAA